MNAITISIAIAAILVLGFALVQGIRAIIYSHSDEWRMQQRVRRYVLHEAE